jgi:hypothetical protein
MTVDEAIRDLLSVSADIRRLAVVDENGDVLGGGPRPAAGGIGLAAGRLWAAATAAGEAHAGDTPLDHVAVDLGDAAVVALESGGRRIVAVTGADPPLGLVVFDLRTCLADVFPEPVAQHAAAGDASRAEEGA